MKLKIQLLSDMNIATGEGRAGNIDSDVYFDQYGLPFIPAKRIKGILRDTAIFVNNLLNKLNKNKLNINYLFGESGKKPSNLIISNAMIENYEENVEYLKYILNKKSSDNERLISIENIIDYFTIIRINTAINEKGSAKDRSLRTIRVLRKDIVFESEIYIPENTIDLFAIVVETVEYMGSNKTNGLGRVKCWLEDKNNKIDTESLRRNLIA